MKKLLVIPILILLISGCSSKISKHFNETKYIRNINVHIVNDSLRLYIKSPADITYTTDRKALKKIIRKEKFEIKDSVLVYGKCSEPDYEYFVTLSTNHNQNYPKNLIVIDTIIDNRSIRFIGNPLSVNSRERSELDLNIIFKTLKVGEGYRKEVSTVLDIVIKHQDSNKFYALLKQISEYPAYDRQDEWMKLQMELTISSFLGNNKFYEKYLHQYESTLTLNDTISKIIKENSQTGSKVIETIVSEAKKHSVVMINENHFYPNHRLFVSDLLEQLKDIGYTYFALETLALNQDSLLNLENTYPTLETGFYTREQNYGNLIRKAKDLGYKFVTYENTDKDKDRELGEAENLYNKTFKLDPNSKVLVLAGMDHIVEKPTSSGKEWMATIFKENYAIDPLTVSQSKLNSYRKQSDADYSIISGAFFESPRYNSVDYLVLNNKKIDAGKSLSTFSYQNNSGTDVQVSLFYGNEILNKNDHSERIPYFTTILKRGKKYDLPINKEGDIYLYTYDINGERMDEQINTPVINVYKE